MPADYEFVRSVGRTLPGTEESRSYGTPALKVGSKTLTRLWEDGETMVLRTTFEDRDYLLKLEPAAFYITDHYRDAPWILVRLRRVRRPQLRELLEQAWRLVAPKRFIAEFDARTRQR
jgi:hypothetical protein